jgi:hypothetical protein
MSDDYKPEYVPFTTPVAPPEDKKKKKEKKPPEKRKEKKLPEKRKGKPLKVISEDIKTYTWQMERFQIMLADSENILVALMLDSAPSEPIKEALLQFTSRFEQKFSTEIENFRGNMSWFRPATEIADDSFNMFLMRPQCLPLTDSELKEISLTSTESKVVRIAQELCKETGYFFLATLLDEVLKRFKMPRERVLSSFFSLNRKKAFIPIHIEDVIQEVQKRLLWDQVSCVDGITDEECNLLLDDLMVSTEESRIALISHLLDFKKKTRSTQVREEIARRRQIRKERDDAFKMVDEYLKASDYNSVVAIFDKIIQLSLDLGEESIAQELAQRAHAYRAELSQMVQRIPMLRSQRNEALNQAELLELNGRYVEAAQQFDLASKLSAEIGEIDKAKEYLSQAERLMSLSELAKLRERLR